MFGYCVYLHYNGQILHFSISTMTESDKERLHRVIGENIRFARERANLKQEAFADRIGLSRASVINIEKGRQAPPLYLIWEISRILEVPVQDFFPKQEPYTNLTENKNSVELEESIVKSLDKHFDPAEESKEKVISFLISNASL